MKILVAVESCLKNRHLHLAMVQTWLANLPQEIDVRFFIGEASSIYYQEVILPVEDSYLGLSMKTREICRWAARARL